MWIPQLTERSFHTLLEQMQNTLKGAVCLEQASQYFCEMMYERFEPIVLIRVFATIPYDKLPKANQLYMKDLLLANKIDIRLTDNMKTLSLLGTYGKQAAWRNSASSKAHRGIPLVVPKIIGLTPMILHFLKEIGVDLTFVSQTNKICTEKSMTSGVFLVEKPEGGLDEHGRYIITDQEFVRTNSIQSVLGFGGNYFLTREDFFCVLIFADSSLKHEDTRFITELGNQFKGMTRDFIVRGRIFGSEGENDRARVHKKELVAAYQMLEIQQEKTERINRELVKANQVKADFIATMSHELQTPLTSIIAYSEVLLEQNVGKDKAREYLYDIYGSAHHLLDLIRDLLNLSKVQNGKMQYHPSFFDLSEVIAVVVQIFRPLLKAKQLNFHFELQKNIPTLYADENKLKQVLMNLMSNAVKFTSAGGRISLRVEYYSGSQEIWMVLQDTGRGMSNDTCRRVFDKYYHMDVDMATECGGLGLGLAISKHIIDMHQGKIWVESVLGKGSSFHIRIPVGKPVPKKL